MGAFGTKINKLDFQYFCYELIYYFQTYSCKNTHCKTLAPVHFLPKIYISVSTVSKPTQPAPKSVVGIFSSCRINSEITSHLLTFDASMVAHTKSNHICGLAFLSGSWTSTLILKQLFSHIRLLLPVFRQWICVIPQYNLISFPIYSRYSHTIIVNIICKELICCGIQQ